MCVGTIDHALEVVNKVCVLKQELMSMSEK